MLDRFNGNGAPMLEFGGATLGVDLGHNALREQGNDPGNTQLSGLLDDDIKRFGLGKGLDEGDRPRAGRKLFPADDPKVGFPTAERGCLAPDPFALSVQDNDFFARAEPNDMQGVMCLAILKG